MFFVIIHVIKIKFLLVLSVKNLSLKNMCTVPHVLVYFFPNECAPILFFMGVSFPRNLYGECLPSVNAPRGLVANGNFEVSVSQVSMPRRASSPRETMR